MSARLFNTLGKIGIGLAIAGSVANSALYNGNITFFHFFAVHQLLNFIQFSAVCYIKYMNIVQNDSFCGS